MIMALNKGPAQSREHVIESLTIVNV